MALPLTPHGKRLLHYPEDFDLSAQAPSMNRPPKRKRLREHEDEDETTAQLSCMPDDVICNVTSYLDIASLLRARLLNRSYRTLASQGSAGWENLCQKLWKDKVHVSPAALEHSDPMAAYRMSILDARDRDYVTREELVFDPDTKAGTVWSFRFKESAGPDWTSWDPWYNRQLCRKMVFLDDGTVKEYSIEDNLENPQFSASRGTLMDPPMSMTWRFLTRPLDLPARPTGSYIRFAVGGRDVPTYCVRRSPTKNWGFIMESCWGVYASFELPKRPSTRIRNPTRRLQTAQDNQGNLFNVEVETGDSSTEGDEEEDSDGLLIDDDSFAITSGLQWREAFLYNFGARVLPEGDEAVADFERTYGAALNT
jgi:hypothetical protein